MAFSLTTELYGIFSAANQFFLPTTTTILDPKEIARQLFPAREVDISQSADVHTPLAAAREVDIRQIAGVHTTLGAARLSLSHNKGDSIQLCRSLKQVMAGRRLTYCVDETELNPTESQQSITMCPLQADQDPGHDSILFIITREGDSNLRWAVEKNHADILAEWLAANNDAAAVSTAAAPPTAPAAAPPTAGDSGLRAPLLGEAAITNQPDAVPVGSCLGTGDPTGDGKKSCSYLPCC